MNGRIQGVHPKQYKGVQYKSTLEADTAETLDKLGLPINYEARKIVLLEGFRCQYQKNKVIGITYKPDFLVGNIIIECKGFGYRKCKAKCIYCGEIRVKSSINQLRKGEYPYRLHGIRVHAYHTGLLCSG